MTEDLPGYDRWKLDGGESDALCERCEGERFFPCSVCAGEGKWIENEEEVICENCEGKGEIPCPLCQ